MFATMFSLKSSGSWSLGMVSTSFVLLVVLLATLSSPTDGQSHMYKFTRYSCEDLKPKHEHSIRKAIMEEAEKSHKEKRSEDDDDNENHVDEPEKSAQTESKPESQNLKSDETTTQRITTTTTPGPAILGTGNSPVTILTSEDKYRRLKHMTVTLQSTMYFEGFMLHAREVRRLGDTKIVGRFIDPPRQAVEITCPQGMQPDNTVLDRHRPVLLTNLTFTWVGPDRDAGTIEFIASVSVQSGKRYYTSRSQPLSLSYFPVSTKDCSQGKSCFRLCPRDKKRCAGYVALYMATLELTNYNRSVIITLGGKVPDPDSYVAIGLSDDGQRLSGADLSVCSRREDGRGVELGHYLLEDVSIMPDIHQGKLFLERQDIDNDQIWCSFTRPLGGNSLTALHLDTPKYLFYFWGIKNGTDLYVPKPSAMKRSSNRISMKDGYFNEVAYDGGGDGKSKATGWGVPRWSTVIVPPVVLVLSCFLW